MDSMYRLKTGLRLPNFTLPDLRGNPVTLSSYRRRSSLLVFFAGQPVTPAFTGLLDELAREYDLLDEHNAEALAVLPVTQREAAALRAGGRDPFPALVDADGEIHRQSGAVGADGEPAFTVAVLDRYGILFEFFIVDENTPPPSIKTLIEWLEYIELQCDE